MTIGDLIVLGILLCWLILSVGYMRRRRKSGRCIGCGGDCAACRDRQQEEKRN